MQGRLPLLAEVRVAVRDGRGELVEELAFPSRSFTFSFANAFLGSMYGSPALASPPSPAFPVVDVLGNTYLVGYGYSNSIGQVHTLMCLAGCPGLSAYASSAMPSPGIYAGYSQCASTAAAIAPCSPIPPSVMSPGPLYVPTVASSTQSAWTFTVTQSLYNVSGSNVTVGSVALVAALYASLASGGILYAVLVDNVNPPLTIPPNYYITVSYTISLPT